MKSLKTTYSRCLPTKIITPAIIRSVKQIVDDHPEYYLDEIQNELCHRMNILLSISALHGILTNKLGYTLQVCYEAAAQRNEGERALYNSALHALTSNVNQLVFVDETHKDRLASRRRRAWGRRNSGGIALIRWFKSSVRYTMIAAMDIDGMIDSSIDCVKRTGNPDQNDTVDCEHFEFWVENYLCPALGSFAKGEARSIVVMDNAATHMSERVGQLVRGTGAYLLYTAPYSPDLNPIELCFNIYKSQLKRNSIDVQVDWYQAHLRVLDTITRDVCIQEFHRCGVPFSNDTTTDEVQK